MSAATPTSINASWQLPPTDSRNGIVNGFKLFYKKKGSAGSPTCVVTIGNGVILNKTVTGLLTYTEYEFQISAFTSVGDGPKSSVMLERTKEDGKGIKKNSDNEVYLCLHKMKFVLDITSPLSKRF